MRTNYVLFVILTMVLGFTVQSQPSPGKETATLSTLKCDPVSSTFIIQGTSSLHDWEMTSNDCRGSIDIQFEEQSMDIKGIRVLVGVTSLKSGKKIMDRKCHDALKQDEHPTIKYTFNKIGVLKSLETNVYSAVLEGSLDIAGVVKNVSIDIIIKNENGKVNITGKKPLKMSDFDVEPPTALLGTLKTGNDITILFNLNYTKS